MQHAKSRSRGRNTLTMAADSCSAPEHSVDNISNVLTIEVSEGLFDYWRGTFLALWCHGLGGGTMEPSFFLNLLLLVLQLP